LKYEKTKNIFPGSDYSVRNIYWQYDLEWKELIYSKLVGGIHIIFSYGRAAKD
jgi:hypothetical protein